MPRKANPFPPIYPLTAKPGDRIYARVWHHGKATDVPLGRKDTPEAESRYAQLVAELAATGGRPLAPAVAPSTLTVADVVARGLVHVESSYPKEGREPENFRLSTKPLLRLFGPTLAADFTSRELRIVQLAMASGSWMNETEQKEAKVVGWCRNVVNRRITRIRTLWRWAEDMGLVPEGRTHHLRVVRGLGRNDPRVRQTARRKATTWEDLAMVLPHCPASVAAMLELQWRAGMRSKEVREMTSGAIDRADTSCWLYRPPDKNAWREQSEDRPRIVPLGPECQRLLGPWLKADKPGAYLFTPAGKRTPYTAFSYAQAVRRASTRAGVKVWAYSGRHAAKRRFTRELGLDAARAALGQWSLGTTNEYDAVLDLETAKEVGRKLA